MTPITAAAIVLVGMLAEADIEGIPAPFDVAATQYGGISLQVDTLDDLTVWAQWFDAPIDDSRKSEGATHYTTHGERDGIRVRVVALVVGGHACTCSRTALENDSRVRIDPHASFLTPAEPEQED